MTPTPKTIQIFLPQGDPRGIRIAEITTRILQVIEVPRKHLSDFLKMAESNQVAMYFLVGNDEEEGNPEVYIGQTGDLKTRLVQHNQNRESWQRALIVVSRTDSLTQTHAVFLEWYCIDQLRQIGRFKDGNKTKGTQPHTPAPLEAECLELYETASTLIATLGFPLFTPLSSVAAAATEQQLFLCTSSDADGKGYYTGEGFVVLAGSRGRMQSVPSMQKSTRLKARQRVIDSGVMKEVDGMLEFQENYLFSSPSMAAVVLMGRHANGWTNWKTESGKTLDEIYRQTAADAET